MKRLILINALVALLIAALVCPATAQDNTMTATVQVAEIMNLTIVDTGASGINFGKPAADGQPHPEVDQSGVGPVTLELGSDTNVSSNLRVSGADWSSGSNSFTVQSVKFNVSSNLGDAKTLFNNPSVIKTVGTGASSSAVYFWITMPSDAPPGTYTSTFSFDAVKAN